MYRVTIGTAVILLAAVSGIGANVAAKGAEKANPPAAILVPAYLKPVPMDLPRTAGSPEIAIDIPVNGTIYPPDLTPPQFAWRDSNPAATVWRVEVLFGEKARPIQVWAAGEKMQIGPVDETLAGYVPPALTPEQAADHTPGAPTPRPGKRSRSIPSHNRQRWSSPDTRARMPASRSRALK
jgi:hypothetical protein